MSSGSATMAAMADVTPERFRCQCAHFSVPCASRMTQEDLLCDTCRKPCGMVVGPSPLAAEPRPHLPQPAEWSVTIERMTPPPGW